MSAPQDSRGVKLTTLVITAVASAAAAYACSKVWAPGTLPSAALTPVMVALIKEALQRPTDVVTRAVPVRGVVRSARARGDEPAPSRDAPSGVPRSGGYEEPTRVAQPGVIADTPRSPRNAARWRLAIITGLLGFVLCALVLTVPELVAGGSVAGGGRLTTLFAGHSTSKKHERTTTTTTTAAPTRTVTAPQRTVTTAPPTKTVPAPATTAPATTTPTTTAPTSPPQPAPPGP